MNRSTGWVALLLVAAIMRLTGASLGAQEVRGPSLEPKSASKSGPLVPGSPEFRKHLERLIEDLGSETFGVRESASQELRGIGVAARTALERASQSTDREVAQRAKAVLAGFPKLTHTIVDALGEPIPLAAVQFTLAPRVPLGQPPAADGIQTETTVTDERGRIGFPDVPANDFTCVVRVQHPAYGIARCGVPLNSNITQVRLPLVRENSELRSRAVTGVVVTPEGKPVAGAVVQCGSVRTPGQGLINGLDPRGDALTDELGQFRFYLPNSNANQERGDAIPPHSHYELRVEVPDDDAYFPTVGKYSNSEPARVELARPVARHRFRWEAVGGGFLDKPAQMPNIVVELLRVRDGEQQRIRIDAQSLSQGRPIVAGNYSAMFFDNGKTIQFQPLSVNQQSPEELVFRLPSAVVFRGRVVHGVTNEPVRDAFVMGWRSTARNNFALFTSDDWKLLRDAPPDPPLDHPAMKRIAQLYGVQSLVRTDADGRFEITRRPDQEFYGLMAFAEDFVPFKVHVGSLQPGADQRIDAATLPLFPAAKVTVRPVFTGKRLSVSPQWLPTDEEQPSWIAAFRAIVGGSNRDFEFVHWLTLNESQPIYVPAGVRLRLRFDVPYDDEWTPALVETPFKLEHRATLDVGDIQFTPSLKVEVQVVNQAGRPVEGFAVRRKYEAINSWCVAHNTNAEGKAFFHAHPNSRGQFRVSDLAGPQEVSQAQNLFVEFRVGDTAPGEPFRITVTDQQIALLGGAKKPAP